MVPSTSPAAPSPTASAATRTAPVRGGRTTSICACCQPSNARTSPGASAAARKLPRFTPSAPRTDAPGAVFHKFHGTPRRRGEVFHKFHTTPRTIGASSTNSTAGPEGHGPSSTNSTPPPARLRPAPVVPHPPRAGQPQAHQRSACRAGPRTLRDVGRTPRRVPPPLAPSVEPHARPATATAGLLAQARVDLARLDSSRSRRPTHAHRARRPPPILGARRRSREARPTKPWCARVGNQPRPAPPHPPPQHPAPAQRHPASHARPRPHPRRISRSGRDALRRGNRCFREETDAKARITPL